MPAATKNVAVFGSTGSIGTNALEVIAASEGRLKVAALSAHCKLPQLLEQARRFKPRWVVATDEKLAAKFDWGGLPAGTELVVGCDSLSRVAVAEDVDIVLAAIVGSAGLKSTWAALDAKKTVALANKETLVMAGSLVTRLAAERGAAILPVDSEHSAIFQALQAGQHNEVRRIVLTASGGPFRELSREQLKQVTVDDALAHPTWEMGPKITVDSATMMNKALEIIESRWLFDLSVEQISVVIHPQSIVHSFVEFVDGSVIAQIGPPDMKLPIQYALEYPHRQNGVADRLDWTKKWQLEFEPADLDRCPALALGFECAKAGGTTGGVLNAANEAAVKAFLEGELHFTEIVPACRSVLEEHHFESDPTLEKLEELDRWARQEVTRWVCA
ncbi:MAG TPA: 1-deoxy-D-xylulose-5-phosphate reductoisomerase [Lacipirellulaceae bacterium]|jgi:1-deoxy-D-xylulose-5-phosphate reductoisomerase|nr:1-deoxy-D-xylulose-5-phosphate reductoisomerase [Lacipirellulaceae bacterium]